MSEADVFDALRRAGIDADDPQIRTAVRAVLEHVEGIRQDAGRHRARRSMEAMRAALDYQLQHPDVADMSSFEADFDDGD